IQLVSKAFQQYFALGLQADDPPKGAEEGDIPRPKNHPTSRHDDGTLRPVDSLQGCTFFGPKSFFTHFGENSANWHSTNLCDHLVRIKNRPAQLVREQLPDRRFAGSHKADKNDGPVRAMHRLICRSAPALSFPDGLEKFFLSPQGSVRRTLACFALRKAEQK